MELDTRLNLLVEAGMLSDNNHDRVKKIISYFQNVEGITLTEENSAPFITHLCASLGRLEKNEPVEEIDTDLFTALSSEPCYEKANETAQKIFSFLPPLPESEKQYILVHICALYTT